MANLIKNYLGIVRDHTGSMRTIKEAAAKDYNAMIQSFKTESIVQGQDTVAYVMQCGIGRPARNVFEAQNSSIAVLRPIQPGHYDVTGDSTPLFDAIYETITALQKVPDYNETNVSFIVMATTDGGDNNSRMSGHKLGEIINSLQKSDRWTFVFRVPRNCVDGLVRLGIPAANILGWDQTERGVEVATVETTSAVKRFYAARSAGKTSSSSFYTDLSNVQAKDVHKKMDNITSEVEVYDVKTKDDGKQIRDFFEEQRNNYLLGQGFYQLTKREKAIQDHKKIVIQNKTSGFYYSGSHARNLLGLPEVGSVAVNPGDHGNFNIFVQSTSVNRKLVAGTKALYWAQVRAL